LLLTGLPAHTVWTYSIQPAQRGCKPFHAVSHPGFAVKQVILSAEMRSNREPGVRPTSR
jgi:hypothetical protein